MSQPNHLTQIQNIISALTPVDASRAASDKKSASNLRPGTFEIEHQTLADPDAVATELKAFIDAHPIETGWVQTTDKLQPFRANLDLDAIILSAEITAGDTSLHIRRGSDENWILSRFKAVDSECFKQESTDEDKNNVSNNSDGFLETLDFCTRKGFKKLRYEVAWHKTRDEFGNEVFIPFASRLAGTTDRND